MTKNFGGASSFINATPPVKKSLNFKESCIGKPPKNCSIDSNSSIIKKLKRNKNSIYLIDESSSEGSHTNREMYVSEIKPSDNFTFKAELSDKNIELAEYYELRESKINLEEEKGDLMSQLNQSEF